MKTLVLEGDDVHDIASFYDEINRVFMAGESWRLGPSLDALDDMLYGGYGAASGGGPLVLVWRNLEKSRARLGIAATRAWYEAKLAQPETFKPGPIRERLAQLERGAGPTYFDMVMEIIASHRRITLQAA